MNKTLAEHIKEGGATHIIEFEHHRFLFRGEPGRYERLMLARNGLKGTQDDWIVAGNWDSWSCDELDEMAKPIALKLVECFVRAKGNRYGRIIKARPENPVAEILDKIQNERFYVHLTLPDAHVMLSKVAGRLVIQISDSALVDELITLLVDKQNVTDEPGTCFGVYDAKRNLVRETD